MPDFDTADVVKPASAVSDFDQADIASPAGNDFDAADIVPAAGEDFDPADIAQPAAPKPAFGRPQAGVERIPVQPVETPDKRIGIGESLRLRAQVQTGADETTTSAVARGIGLGLPQALTPVQDKWLQYLAEGGNQLKFGAAMAGLDLPFMRGALDEWDAAEGKAIADPKQRKRARQQFVQTLATEALRERVQNKVEAGQELSERERTLWAKVGGGAVENIGYMGAFALGPTMAVGTSAARRMGELTTDKLALGKDGELAVEAKGDTLGGAIPKAAAGAALEYGIERVGGKLVGGLIGRAVKSTPGLRTVVDAALKNPVVGKAVESFGRLGRVTGVQGLPEELAEELAQDLVDVGIGLGLRSAEKRDTDMLQRSAQAIADFDVQEIALSMLLTQAAQGGAAGVQALNARVNQGNVADKMLTAFGVAPDTLKGMTREQKVQTFNTIRENIDPAEARKLLAKLGDRAVEAYEQYDVETADGFRPRGPATPQSIADAKARYVQGVVNRIAKGVNTEVYDTEAEALAAHPEIAKSPQFVPGAFTGTYLPPQKDASGNVVKDSVVVMALDKLPTPQEVVATVLHEAGVHDALDRFMPVADKRRILGNLGGNVYQQVLEQKQAMESDAVKRANDALAAIEPLARSRKQEDKDRYAAEAKRIREARDAELASLSPELTAEETLATLWENRASNPSAYERAVAYVRGKMRNLFPSLTFTDSDIKVMFADAAEGIRNGEGRFTRKSVAGDAAAFAADAREKAAAREAELRAAAPVAPAPAPAATPATTAAPVAPAPVAEAQPAAPTPAVTEPAATPAVEAPAPVATEPPAAKPPIAPSDAEAAQAQTPAQPAPAVATRPPVDVAPQWDALMARANVAGRDKQYALMDQLMAAADRLHSTPATQAARLVVDLANANRQAVPETAQAAPASSAAESTIASDSQTKEISDSDAAMSIEESAKDAVLSQAQYVKKYRIGDNRNAPLGALATDHTFAVRDAVATKQPIGVQAWRDTQTNIVGETAPIPAGYVRDGDRYVYRPDAAPAVQPEAASSAVGQPPATVTPPAPAKRRLGAKRAAAATAPTEATTPPAAPQRPEEGLQPAGAPTNTTDGVLRDVRGIPLSKYAQEFFAEGGGIPKQYDGRVKIERASTGNERLQNMVVTVSVDDQRIVGGYFGGFNAGQYAMMYVNPDWKAIKRDKNGRETIWGKELVMYGDTITFKDMPAMLKFYDAHKAEMDALDAELGVDPKQELADFRANEIKEGATTQDVAEANRVAAEFDARYARTQPAAPQVSEAAPAAEPTTRKDATDALRRGLGEFRRQVQNGRDEGRDSGEVQAPRNMYDDDIQGAARQLSGELGTAADERGAARFRRVTPEQDAAYMAAVERGDTAEAQRMVDEAARAAGYDSPQLFRGSVEDDGVELPQSFEAGGGIFLTDSEDVANIFTYPREYGEVITQVYDEEAEDYVDVEQGPILRAYARLRNPLVLTRNTPIDSRDFVMDSALQARVIRDAKRDGHDGIIVRETQEGVGDWMEPGTTYVVFNSSQVKLSAPMTKDDAGRVIPLSERFNDATPDIRFRRTPPPRAVPSATAANRELMAEVEGVYDDVFSPRTVEGYMNDAQDEYATDVNAAEVGLLSNESISNKPEDQARRMARDKLAVDGLTARAIASGDETNIAKAKLGIWRWYERGTEVARALRLRFDPLETPEARRAWLDRAIIAPSDQERERLKRSQSQAEAIEAMKPAAKRAMQTLRRLKAEGKDYTQWTAEQLMDDNKFREMLTDIEAKRAARGDRVHEWWRNAILSAPTTPIVNAIGNAGNAGLEAFVQRPVEVLLNNFVKSPDAATANSLRAMYKAITPSLRQAARNFRESFRTERTVTGPESSKLDSARVAIPKRYGGKIVRVPQRIMTATDEFFKTVFMSMLVADYATRDFDRRVKEGTKSEVERDEFLRASMTAGSKAYNKAWDEALRWSFQQQNGRIGQGFSRMRDDPTFGFFIKFVLPFVKTPANIVATGMRKSPAGMLPFLYKLATKQYGGSAEAQAKGIKDGAEQLVGMVLLWSIIDLVQGDDDDELNRPRLTGSRKAGGSASPGERETEQRNYPPMSIRFGDKWVSYARIEPLATVLGTLADVATAWQMAKRGQGDEIPGVVFNSMKANFRDKTFLSGVGDIIDILENGDEQKLVQYGSRIVAGFNPNLVKSFVRSFDPYVRDMRNRDKGMAWMKTSGERLFQQIVPSADIAPIPRYDLAGRPVEKVGGPMAQFLSPVRQQRADLTTKVDAMFSRYNAGVAKDMRKYPAPPTMPVIKPLGTKRPVRLTDPEFGEFQRIAGERAAARLDAMTFNYDEPTERDIERVMKVYEDARSFAKKRITPIVLARWRAEGGDGAK